MINVNENTIMIGTSELRTQMPQISKEIGTKQIILTKRGKPIAILQDYESYEQKEKMLDEYEDIIFGYLAKSRTEKTKENEYLSHEEMIKKLGLI